MNICCSHKLSLDIFPDASECKPEYGLGDILCGADGQIKIIYLYSTDTLLNLHKSVQKNTYTEEGEENCGLMYKNMISN